MLRNSNNVFCRLLNKSTISSEYSSFVDIFKQNFKEFDKLLHLGNNFLLQKLEDRVLVKDTTGNTLLSCNKYQLDPAQKKTSGSSSVSGNRMKISTSHRAHQMFAAVWSNPSANLVQKRFFSKNDPCKDVHSDNSDNSASRPWCCIPPPKKPIKCPPVIRSEGLCCRVKMPGCRKSCRYHRKFCCHPHSRKCTRRIRTPRAAFSECERDPICLQQNPECVCLEKTSPCLHDVRQCVIPKRTRTCASCP